MSEVVILDLDGVIISGQSQQIFLRYLFNKKLVGLFFYFRIHFWFILYKLGLIKSPKRIMEYAFSFLKNKKIEEFDRITDNFFSAMFFTSQVDDTLYLLRIHTNKENLFLCCLPMGQSSQSTFVQWRHKRWDIAQRLSFLFQQAFLLSSCGRLR